MIGARVLADTNVVSYLFKDSELASGYRSLINGRPTGIALISLAELNFGAASDRWGSKRLERMDSFLDDFIVIPGNHSIALIAAYLRNQRARIGREIDWPDAWVAATALWYRLPLATHDRDFHGIPGLQLLTLHEDWRVAEPRIRYGGRGHHRHETAYAAHRISNLHDSNSYADQL